MKDGSDRDIINWEKRLQNQCMRGWENYERFRYDLTAAKDNEYLGLCGEFLIVEGVSSKSALANIRLNLNRNDTIDLEIGTQIKSIFHTLYITNAAQPGEWIDLVVGINFEYYRQQSQVRAEAQPCIIITNVAADANTVGAANVCNKVLIRAFTTNTGLVWVDFHTPAVENQCYPLDAGDAISVALRNTDQINALFKVANEDVAVVFEV